MTAPGEREEEGEEEARRERLERNKEWRHNVQFEESPDTARPPDYHQVTLFHPEVESYAMSQTSPASPALQTVARLTTEHSMFMPCMVGSLESQLLKMICQRDLLESPFNFPKRSFDFGKYSGMQKVDPIKPFT